MRKISVSLLCTMVGSLLLAQAAFAQSKDRYNLAKQVFDKQMAQAKKDKQNEPTKRTFTIKDGNGWQKKVINKTVIDVWVGKSPRVEPVNPDPVLIPGKEKPTPIQTCVRVWAELSDEKGTQTNQFVNLEFYKFLPEQRFYFWLESPTPVQLSLTQYYDVGPSEAKQPKLVSPDERFPKTFATVRPGTPFRFPQLFKVDKTQADEFVTLTVIRASETIDIPSPPTEPPTKPVVCPVNTPGPVNTPDPPVVGTMQLTQTCSMMGYLNQNSTVLIRKDGKRTYKNKAEEYRRLEAVNPIIPSPEDPKVNPKLDPGTYTTNDYHTIAMFALGSQTMGHLPLRIRKR